nr:hypothetical protein [Tanacetum cinerariifolium]
MITTSMGYQYHSGWFLGKYGMLTYYQRLWKKKFVIMQSTWLYVLCIVGIGPKKAGASIYTCSYRSKHNSSTSMKIPLATVSIMIYLVAFRTFDMIKGKDVWDLMKLIVHFENSRSTGTEMF